MQPELLARASLVVAHDGLAFLRRRSTLSSFTQQRAEAESGLMSRVTAVRGSGGSSASGPRGAEAPTPGDGPSRRGSLDEQTFEELYLKYRPKLVSYAAKRGATDPEGVADLALFDWYRAYDQLDDQSEAALRSYVYRAAANFAISEHRRIEIVPTELGDHDLPPAPDPSEEITEQWLWDLVDQLTPLQRTVIYRRFHDDQASEAIAELLDRNPNAVHQIQHRALKRLLRLILAAAVAVVVVLVLRSGWAIESVDTSPVDRPTIRQQDTQPSPDDPPQSRPGQELETGPPSTVVGPGSAQETPSGPAVALDAEPGDAGDSDFDGQPGDPDPAAVATAVATSGVVASQQAIAPLDDIEAFGSELATIGDLDGDGITDLAVGLAHDDDGGTDRGAVVVLLLHADGTVKAEQKINSTQGGLIGPLDDGDQFGSGVAGAGDLDRDGVPDIVVGAQYDDDGGSNRGAVWVLFLNADGTVKAEQKISSTRGGLTRPLADLGEFGNAVGSAGDVNGDGVSDLAVGQWRDSVNRGAVWVLFLNADGTVKAEQKISSTEGGLTGPLDTYDWFGFGVNGIGDINDDGVPDLAVGAPQDDDGGSDQGAAYVLFLDPDGTVKAEQKISSTEGGLSGPLGNLDYFGASVAGIGDLDQDGTPDVAVGAYLDDDGGTYRGAVYVLELDTNGTIKAEYKISSTRGRLPGPLANNDYFGDAIAGLGDLDSDGTIGLAIGASGDDTGGSNRGKVYILDLQPD